MASTIRQRLRRFNGTDYDTIYLETNRASVIDFPSSMPASDVYAWAKAANKPSYTYSEVGAAAASHGHDYVEQSHYLRTFNASGGSHGTSWLMKCQHNIYGDGRFGIRTGDGSLGTRVDYATGADSAGQATNATNATYLNIDATNTKFHWAGQGGQPNWLWGGNDADVGNMYVWNPSNFSVAYAANTATPNGDTIVNWLNWLSSRISALENAGGLKAQVVSYTGNGASGVNNPTTITFNFAPMIIFASRGSTWTTQQVGNYDRHASNATNWPTAYSQGYGWGTTQYNLTGMTSSDRKTYRWHGYSAPEQNNENGGVYYYLGIGM